MSETTTAAETPRDFGEPPAGEAKRWLAEIEAHEKEFSDWHERCDKIAARYLMEGRTKNEERRFALLWSNVEVLKPTLYARDPKPAVTRRFRDRDMAARTASSLLERCLATLLDRGAGAFGRTARAAVLDRVLFARAVTRARYVPTIREGVVQDEDVTVEWVHRRDFGHTAGARCWDEVSAVWFKIYLTRDEMVGRFGEVGRTAPLNCKRPGATEEKPGTEDVFSKAEVYEIWDSVARRVTWVSKGVKEPLDQRPYPLKIGGKFPCAAPLYGTLGNGSLIPVPDYVFYQDQAEELDTLTARIAKLVEACRVVGFTPGESAGDLQRALSSADEATIVPVASWAMNGEAKGMVSWLPIAEVAACLARLMEAREAVKRDAWEVTGLSDILRGQSQASETATAQNLKAQWGGIRVRDAQQDVARLCAQLLNLMAEIVCGHFEPERIALLGHMEGLPEAGQPAGPPQPPMPGMMPAPPPTVGQKALELLKGPGPLLHARVDVESDSTVAPDEDAKRKAVAEVMTGVANVFQQALPIMPQMAQTGGPAVTAAFARLMGEMVGMALRTVRGGEAVESAAERFTEALEQAGQQPPPQQPGAPDPGQPTAADQVKMAGVETDRERMRLEEAVARDESRHRDEDRQVEVAKMRLEAMRPETAVVQ